MAVATVLALAPSLSLPRRKSGLPDLRIKMRNPGRPGFRAGEGTLEQRRGIMTRTLISFDRRISP
jgi:hypothetical protein